MKRITTESGAVYLYDYANGRVQRVEGPYSALIDYDAVPDGKWQTLTGMSPLIIGESVQMTFVSGKWRITTPLVSIEEVEEV